MKQGLARGLATESLYTWTGGRSRHSKLGAEGTQSRKRERGENAKDSSMFRDFSEIRLAGCGETRNPEISALSHQRSSLDFISASTPAAEGSAARLRISRGSFLRSYSSGVFSPPG